MADCFLLPADTDWFERCAEGADAEGADAENTANGGKFDGGGVFNAEGKEEEACIDDDEVADDD